MPRQRNFILVGTARGLILQTLLALHAFSKVKCVVISGREAHFLRFSSLLSDYVEIDLSGKNDEQFVQIVNRFCNSMPELALIPTDCDGSRMINRVRNRLSVKITPAPDSAMLE